MAKSQMGMQDKNLSPGHKKGASTSHRVAKVARTGTITQSGKTGASNMGKGKFGSTMC